MNVPFLDLRAAHEELRPDLEEAVGRVVDSGRFVLGEEVAAFEREFADYCGVAHCVGVNSGLDALNLALRASGVEAGDGVLVPAHTFIATWLAVSQIGAVPVPVPVRDDSFNIDPARIERALTPTTRALVAVHLYGQPAEMEAVMELAERHGLTVVEDAAQAHGAHLSGRRAGALGHAGAFSFYPGKNLGAMGDGGAITTGDAGLAERCRLLRNYGSSRKYHHDVEGVNSRLDELQAAVLRVKLRRLDEWNDRRRGVAGRYEEGLAGTELVLPAVSDGVEPVWHLFVVRHGDRDGLRARLADQGIETLIHYPVAPHRSGAYADRAFDGPAVEGAEALAGEVLSLPMGPQLEDGQVQRVVDAVRTAIG